MTLLDYITLSHRWAWSGVAPDAEHHYCDCTIYPADWCLLGKGFDPAAGLRGSYSTAEEANAIVDREGGMVSFVSGRLAPFGAKRVQEPRDGDIGVVRVMTGFDLDSAQMKEIPAIRFGKLWSVMSARGSMTKKLDHIAAWSVL